jgi:putative transposase
MARPLRIEFPGAVYHITSRGNAQQPVFLADADRTFFLIILSDVIKTHHWVCHAYCLMDNHYHLLMETPNANLSRGMRQLNGIYTQMFNLHHHRTGHVFQGRYKAILVEKESHLLEVARYIVMNPVRAGSVTQPQEWKWSSYRATAGIEKKTKFLEIAWLLSQFSENHTQAQAKYRTFVTEQQALSPWDNLSGQVILGRKEFVYRLQLLMKESMPSKEVPWNQRLIGSPSLETIFKGATTRKIRNKGIVKARGEYEYKLKEIGDYLGLYYSTVSRLFTETREKTAKRKT